MFQNVASPLRAIFGVFAVLALSVTGLLIYSIVSVAVEERIREYAILRTVGARRTDIFRLVLSESVFLCCLGVLPGVLAGAVVAVGFIATAIWFRGRRGVVDRQRVDSRPAGHPLAYR